MRQFPFFLRNGVVPGRVSLNEFAAYEPVIEKLVEKSHPAARHKAVWDRAPTGNVIGLAPLYAIQPLMPLTLKPHPLGENDFDVFRRHAKAWPPLLASRRGLLAMDHFNSARRSAAARPGCYALASP